MDAFTGQLWDRLPLAAATLTLFDHMFDDSRLKAIYDAHRGRCHDRHLKFQTLLRLVRDALLQHGGSGHAMYIELERAQAHPADESSFYRKLANMPVDVSRALLRECTPAVRDLMAPTMSLPTCFDDMTAVVLDGKKIKNAAKRLAPTRGYSGRLLGAKALVALDVRRGLALAMSDSLDGEANDVPLVPQVLPQVREVIAEAVLWLADRQFGDTTTLGRLADRPGDHFVVRVRKNLQFQCETCSTSTDAEGRTVTDEVGVLGSGASSMRVRRVTLHRDDDPVQLVTDLMDEARYSADDLLALYRERWAIERVFQEVTETFNLKHLIGCQPRAILFQFAFCLLMYNLVQAIKSFVADAGAVATAWVSTHRLFYDIKRELTTWAYLTDGRYDRRRFTTAQMRAYLRDQLRDAWDPIAHRKARDANPRPPRQQAKTLPGGHTSVQRLIEQKGAAKATAQ